MPVPVGVHVPDRVARVFFTGGDPKAIHVRVTLPDGVSFTLAVPGPTWEDFERVHEVAFRHFGGGTW